jgi:NAD(P)H-hydrate epimerase
MIESFISDTGVEVPAVSAAQMREVDRIATEETGPNLFQMIENAGRNLASLSIQLVTPIWHDALVVVLAGPGGNGGGGICAARHLANHGANVWLCLADAEHLGSVPAYQRKVFASTPGTEVDSKQLVDSRPDLIIDAVLGYSLSGAPRGRAAELIEWANVTGAPILALDLPSGLDATTGSVPGAVIAPRWTMTLALPKTGLLPQRVGELYLADIGIPQAVYDRMKLPYRTPFDHRYRVSIKPKRSDGRSRQ